MKTKKMSSCEYEFTVTRSVETKLGMAGVFVFSGNGSQCATSATGGWLPLGRGSVPVVPVMTMILPLSLMI